MAKIDDVVRRIEEFAPLESMEVWDNSGWQINLGNNETKKIMLALNASFDTVKQAVNQRCDLLLVHHPLFFEPVKLINQPEVVWAIQNNLQIYSAHTNLDKAKDGTSDTLMAKMKKSDFVRYNEFVRVKQFDVPVSVEKLIENLKKDLGLSTLRIINQNTKQCVRNIACCAGAGGSLITELEKSGVDFYVTGDVKYHEALAAGDIVVIDIGHYDSEKYVVDIFKKILENIDIEVVAADEKNVWQVV